MIRYFIMVQYESGVLGTLNTFLYRTREEAEKSKEYFLAKQEAEMKLSRRFWGNKVESPARKLTVVEVMI